MKFQPTQLKDVWVLELDKAQDERGFFARAWCQKEFAERGLHTDFVQMSFSWNAKRGTLRGLHFQAEPHSEIKIVRCVQGALVDVVLDLRPDSATFGRHLQVELSAENGRALYIPQNCAHGFQTLSDHTMVLYQISAFYEPSAFRGVRWNDPSFAIRWPAAEPLTISERDQNLPLWPQKDLPAPATAGSMPGTQK